MQLKAERSMFDAVEGLGAFVLLREKLTQLGLSRSFLNVQDSEPGQTGSEGVQVVSPVDGGVRLTLQDFAGGRRYNCTLRGTDEKKWDGTAVAEQLRNALREMRFVAEIPPEPRRSSERKDRPRLNPPSQSSLRSMSILVYLRKQHPDRIVSVNDVREAGKKLSIEGTASYNIARKLENRGCLVRLDAPYAQLFGVMPQDETVTKDAWRLRCEDLLRTRHKLTRHERLEENITRDEGRLLALDAQILKLQDTRDGLAAQIENEKRELLPDEDAEMLRARIKTILEGSSADKK